MSAPFAAIDLETRKQLSSSIRVVQLLCLKPETAVLESVSYAGDTLVMTGQGTVQWAMWAFLWEVLCLKDSNVISEVSGILLDVPATFEARLGWILVLI